MTGLPDLFSLTLQTMPRRWARFCLDIAGFVRTRLQIRLSGTTLLVGFSTGIDSTALLVWARIMSRQDGFAVHAAHCNHGLRPESGREAAAAAEICAALDIPLHMTELPVREHSRTRGIGLEEAGRELRYDFLLQTSDRIDADWVLTGHHQNDLAEDLVMRLVRGTGWPGLAGMRAADRSRNLLRPFLHTPKSTLHEFLTDLNLPWCEDDSNTDLSFRRNRVRHEILPLLLQENPAFLQSASRLWDQGDRDEAYWEERTWSGVELQNDGRVVIPAPQLSEHPALRYRLYKRALDMLGPGQALNDSLDRLDRIVAEKKTGKRVQFPGDKVARLAKEGLEFFVQDRHATSHVEE